jgi:RNA polymerase sigma-70 factor, ECF subfamily
VEGTVDEPDPQVVAAARGGDLGAFEVLVRHYQGGVWRLTFQLLRDEGLADDVTQDTFVRAMRFLPRYRGESKFSTWLFSIARNCAMDELRRLGRRARAARRASAGAAMPVGDPNVGIEVREVVAALSMELREPVVLIDMFGLSYKEAAMVLRIPTGTVKSRLHRARRSIVEALTERPEETHG